MENGAAMVMEHPPKNHTTNKKYLKQREPNMKMSRKPKYENNYNQEVNCNYFDER